MKTRIITSLLILSFFFNSSCRNNSFNYDESIRSLKVLNSDMLNFFNGVSEKDEFKAIDFFWNQPSAPLPFQKEEFVVEKNATNYFFDSLKGNYFWNVDSQKFIMTGISDKLEINVSEGISGLPQTSFIISKFAQEEIGSRPPFPTEIEATLFQNNENKITIIHNAIVQDNLPLEIHSFIEGTDYKGSLTLNRTKQGENGTLKIKFDLERKNIHFIQNEVNAKIGYSSLGYYFNEIEFNSRLFSHQINGIIHYSEIDPTARDYVNSWNSNSEIEIFEMPGKRKVGNVVLGKTEMGELQDYFIRFNNGKEELLVDYLPFLDKILNFKY